MASSPPGSASVRVPSANRRTASPQRELTVRRQAPRQTAVSSGTTQRSVSAGARNAVRATTPLRCSTLRGRVSSTSVVRESSTSSAPSTPRGCRAAEIGSAGASASTLSASKATASPRRAAAPKFGSDAPSRRGQLTKELSQPTLRRGESPQSQGAQDSSSSKRAVGNSRAKKETESCATTRREGQPTVHGHRDRAPHGSTGVTDSCRARSESPHTPGRRRDSARMQGGKHSQRQTRKFLSLPGTR